MYQCTTNLKHLLQSSGLTLMMTSLFIISNNMMGLLHYIFMSTSYLVYSVAPSLPPWINLIIRVNWKSNIQTTDSSSSAQSMLMPFMLCIGAISNLMLPGPWAVWPTANAVASQLLIGLLGNNSMNSSSIIVILLMSAQISHFVFEMSVATSKPMYSMSALYFIL